MIPVVESPSLGTRPFVIPVVVDAQAILGVQTVADWLKITCYLLIKLGSSLEKEKYKCFYQS